MDYKTGLKPSAFVELFAGFGSENAEQLGFGYSYISKNNLAWFLLKYRMEFNDYPSSVYNLTVKNRAKRLQ
jgi:medium-chain acyl-[acyl-carrier-protein] hydrolase